jgi:hypothetical protein
MRNVSERLVVGGPVQEEKPSAAGRKSKGKVWVEGPLGVTERTEGGREA